MIASQGISEKNIAQSINDFTLKYAIYFAAALSLTAAMIHLWATPAHFIEWWGYGIFFAAAAFAQGLYGIFLLRWPGKRLFYAGIAGNLAIISLFIAGYTAGMPFGPHAGTVHSANVLGFSATGAEVLLVLTLLARARGYAAARPYVAIGAVLSFGVGLLLHTLHIGAHGAHGLNPILHWAFNSSLLIPLSALILWIATYVSRRIVSYSGFEDSFSISVTWALVVAVAYAGASVPANGFVIPKIGTGTFIVSALGDAGAALGAGFLLLLGLAFVRGLPWETPKVINFWRPRAFVFAAGLAAAIAVVAGPSLFGQDFSKPAVAQADQSCSADSYNRSYSVSAFNVEIPFNRWGDLDPDGQVFGLSGDKEAIQNWWRPLADDPANDPAGN
ncbi:MAG: hypothetical protein WA982_03660, partial [Rubrobacteraceae bacterium]